MAWQMLAAQFGLNALQGLGARQQAKAQGRLTAAENLVNNANVASANLVREANNDLAAAVGSLNRFRQAASNRAVMANSGKDQEAIQTNFLRAVGDLQRGSMEQRLDTAFELGAVAAMASAAGVAGGSRDAINATIRMTEARRQEELSRVQGQMTYDAMKLLTNTQADTYNQLDGTLFLDAIDRGRNIFMPQFEQRAPGLIGTLFGSAATTVAQNPLLTQQVAEGFRSTSPPRDNGSSWYSNVSLKV